MPVSSYGKRDGTHHYAVVSTLLFITQCTIYDIFQLQYIIYKYKNKSKGVSADQLKNIKDSNDEQQFL